MPASTYLRESFAIRIKDGQLKLSFSGAAPRINALDIQMDNEALVLFLAGDSTVTDQGEEGYPYAGWGQLLPRCFKAGIVVDNRALSDAVPRVLLRKGIWRALPQISDPEIICSSSLDIMIPKLMI